MPAPPQMRRERAGGGALDGGLIWERGMLEAGDSWSPLRDTAGVATC